MLSIIQHFRFLLLTISSLLLVTQLEANEPFLCDYSAYLFQYNDVYAIDLASGNAYLVAESIVDGTVNAAAYNPADGYIWGALSTPDHHIVRIGKNFNVTTYEITGLPASNPYIGDISQDGIYYLKSGGTTYHSIDLNPATSQYNSIIQSQVLSQSINIHDWAFNAVDGLLYSVEKSSNKLYRINPVNGQVTNLGVVPILNGFNYVYGAVYFDNTGAFYVSANQTGSIYVIEEVQNITINSAIQSNIFAFGPSSNSNDGARCPTAPVAREICDNGIDDDGDGLIDCNDPSCSGVGGCEERTNTTSGNDGGLESNNRLSNAINKRNYTRTKTNFELKLTPRNRVTKMNGYGKKAINNRINDIPLQSFIPFEIIPNAEAYETSPTDLLTLTNAVDILSIDYIKEDKRVAALLALKTESSVYEHSKFICDRLLGAELLSVSTILLNEQPFIKSIIKSATDEIEFVLSFAARMDNDNFIIENHWNIDKYTPNSDYYNFQIWANTIDDALNMGQEILNLIHVQAPISDYKISSPPPVFVRSASYQNGALDLNIINSNRSQSAKIEGGVRTSETNTESTIYEEINIDQYLNKYTYEVGNLFDIGFRLTNNLDQTPDDLYISDGPWGLDDSDQLTTTDNYQVIAQNNELPSDVYPIERGIELSANIQNYIAVHKAFTPRYQAVNFSDYNELKFTASGTEELEITIVKNSISNWEDQFRTSIYLSADERNYALNLYDFTSSNNEALDLSDVKMIVFTLRGDNNNNKQVKLNLKNIFWNKNEMVTSTQQNSTIQNLTFFPNPISTTAAINFTSEKEENFILTITNAGGQIVKQQEILVAPGYNEQNFNRDNLANGIYFFTLGNESKNWKGKLVFTN